MSVGLAVRDLNHSLTNPIPCVLDILEVLVEDTEQPRFLPWEFATGIAMVQTIWNLNLSKTDLQNVRFSNGRFSDPHCIRIMTNL